MDWPANEFSLATVARNIYLSVNSYKDATDLVDWCGRNPDAWELVTLIMQLREGK